MKMLHVKDDTPSSPASLKRATEQRADDAKDGAAAMSAAELEAQWLKVRVHNRSRVRTELEGQCRKVRVHAEL